MNVVEPLRIGHIVAECIKTDTDPSKIHIHEPGSIDMDEVVLDLAQAQALHEWLGRLIGAGLETVVSCEKCGVTGRAAGRGSAAIGCDREDCPNRYALS